MVSWSFSENFVSVLRAFCAFFVVYSYRFFVDFVGVLCWICVVLYGVWCGLFGALCVFCVLCLVFYGCEVVLYGFCGGFECVWRSFCVGFEQV